MSQDDDKTFNTLKGFVKGEESDEPIYFAFRATLRIFGDDLPFDEITRVTGLQPTRRHHKGEFRKPTSTVPYKVDAWFLESNLPESEPLGCHIDALWKNGQSACSVFEVSQGEIQS